MDIRRKIKLIAIKEFPEFNPKKDMNRTFDSLGIDSLDRLGLVMRVENVCHVSISDQLLDKLKSVSDVVVAVENLKKVKKTNDTWWVPCALNKTRQCCFMSDAWNDSMWRSKISPNADFCNVMACSLYRVGCRQR